MAGEGASGMGDAHQTTDIRTWRQMHAGRERERQWIYEVIRDFERKTPPRSSRNGVTLRNAVTTQKKRVTPTASIESATATAAAAASAAAASTTTYPRASTSPRRRSRDCFSKSLQLEANGHSAWHQVCNGHSVSSKTDSSNELRSSDPAATVTIGSSRRRGTDAGESLISHAKSPFDIRNAGRGTLGLGSPPISPQEYSPPRPRAIWQEACQGNDEAHPSLRGNITAGSLRPDCEVGHESKEEAVVERKGPEQERAQHRLSRGGSGGASKSAIVSREQRLTGDSRNMPGRAIGQDSTEVGSDWTSAEREEAAQRTIGGGVSHGSFALLAAVALAAFGVGTLLYPWPRQRTQPPSSSSLPKQEIAPPRSSSRTSASGPTVFEIRAKRTQERKSERWTSSARGEDARDWSRIDHAPKRASTVRGDAGGVTFIVPTSAKAAGNPPAGVETGSIGAEDKRPSKHGPAEDLRGSAGVGGGRRKENACVACRSFAQRGVNDGGSTHGSKPVPDFELKQGAENSFSHDRCGDGCDRFQDGEMASPRPSRLPQERNSFKRSAMEVSEMFKWNTRADSSDTRRGDFDGGQGGRSSTAGPTQRHVFAANREAFARTLGSAEQRLHLASSEGQWADRSPDGISWRVASTTHAARRACDAVASGGAGSAAGGMGGGGPCDSSAVDVERIWRREEKSAVVGAIGSNGDEVVKRKVGHAEAGTTPGVSWTDVRDLLSPVDIENPTRTASPDEGLAQSISRACCDRLVVSGDDMPACFTGRYTLVTGESARLTPGAPPIPPPIVKTPYYCRETERVDVGESAELKRTRVPGSQQPSLIHGGTYTSEAGRDASDWMELESVCRDSFNDAVFQPPAAEFSAPESTSNSAVDPPEGVSFDPSLEVENGELCLYWVYNEGGRWVLDDDLRLSTGVLAVTADQAPQAACAAFPIRPRSPGFQSDRRGDGEGDGGYGGTPFGRSSWLVDSPRLREWVPADDFQVLCETD